MNSPYRLSSRTVVVGPRWGITRIKKMSVRMKKFIIKTLDFLGGINWGFIGGLVFFGGLISLICILCYLVDLENNKEKEKNMHAPCSEFLSSTMDKVPARCVKEYLKN